MWPQSTKFFCLIYTGLCCIHNALSSLTLQNDSIVNRASGRCLEVVPAKAYFGHLVVLQPCTGQTWSIKNTVKP